MRTVAGPDPWCLFRCTALDALDLRNRDQARIPHFEAVQLVVVDHVVNGLATLAPPGSQFARSYYRPAFLMARFVLRLVSW